jgi:CRP-like cAMP-binding protein
MTAAMLYTHSSTADPQPDLRQLLEDLYRQRTLHPYSSGQTIPLEVEDIWIVCRGVVQLGTLYDNGDESLLGLASPSMPFGLPLTLIRPYQAIALSDVDLLRLSTSEVASSPTLAQSIFHHVARRLQQTEAILAMNGYRRVEDRLRHLLVLLQQQVGLPSAKGTRISIRLTHQQLANAIGTTRVTVTRLLNQLRDEGYLLIDENRHITMPHR